jgi:hypothetical protein
LFRSSELSEQRTVNLPADSLPKPVLAFGVDEYSEIAWLVRDDQSIDVVSLLDGTLLKSWSPPAKSTTDKANAGKANEEKANGEKSSPQSENATASAGAKVRIAKVDSQQSSVLLGLDDGSVRVILCSMNVEFKPDAQMPSEITESMKTSGKSTLVQDGVIYRQMPSGLIRAVSFSNASYLEPIQVFETPIDHIDWTLRSDTSGFGDSQKGFLAVASAGNIALGNIERQAGGIGGKAKQSITIWRAEPTQGLSSNSPDHGLAGLMISGLGDTLLSVDQAGEMQRWKAEGADKLVSLGGYKTVTAETSQLSSSEPLLGRSSWALGNRHGEVETVAITASTSGQELRSIHRVSSGLSPVTRIASSPSQRLLAVTGPGSGLKVIHVTSERIVAGLNDLKVAIAVLKNWPRTLLVLGFRDENPSSQ